VSPTLAFLRYYYYYYYYSIPQVNAEQFEWVNRNNIKAGSTTCGFLKRELGTEPDVNYPKIKIYICIKFAAKQPAPKGNLFVHCGGPGTLSNCIGIMADDIGQDNTDNYNIIGVDQVINI